MRRTCTESVFGHIYVWAQPERRAFDTPTPPSDTADYAWRRAWRRACAPLSRCRSLTLTLYVYDETAVSLTSGTAACADYFLCPPPRPLTGRLPAVISIVLDSVFYSSTRACCITVAEDYNSFGFLGSVSRRDGSRRFCLNSALSHGRKGFRWKKKICCHWRSM